MTAVAPATTANLGPGFDVFGLALDIFHDSLEVSLAEKDVKIVKAGKYADAIPSNPDKNAAGVVAKLFLKMAKVDAGVRIKIDKGIRPGYGLGSSGASAAAAAVALDRLLETNCSELELIRMAAQGEVVSAGVPHVDNVAPAILGGFTIVRCYDPLDVVKLAAPKSLEVAVAIPDVETPPEKTKSARSILPKTVQLSQVTYNLGHASTIVAGIALSDIGLIGRGMFDCIVEPVRARLIPGYERVKRGALEAGASGVAISGAGPAMIALVDAEKIDAMGVAQAMKKAFEEEGVRAEAYRAKPSEGTRILGETK